MKYFEGDKIITKKVHPCGSNEWEIIRVGADVKLKCKGCSHILILGYDKVEKITKKYIPVNKDV